MVWGADDEEEDVPPEPHVGEIKSAEATQNDNADEKVAPTPDVWEVRGETLVRVHHTPRQRLFMPIDAHDQCPWKVEDIDVFRTTVAHLDLDEITQEIRDIWGVCDDTTDRRDLGQPWTGETSFTKYSPANEPGYTSVAGRRTRTQKTKRPPNVWPEMWQIMSAKDRSDAIDIWKGLEPQYEAAMKHRAIYTDVVHVVAPEVQVEAKAIPTAMILTSPAAELADLMPKPFYFMPVVPLPTATVHMTKLPLASIWVAGGTS